MNDLGTSVDYYIQLRKAPKDSNEYLMMKLSIKQFVLYSFVWVLGRIQFVTPKPVNIFYSAVVLGEGSSVNSISLIFLNIKGTNCLFLSFSVARKLS